MLYKPLYKTCIKNQYHYYIGCYNVFVAVIVTEHVTESQTMGGQIFEVMYKIILTRHYTKSHNMGQININLFITCETVPIGSKLTDQTKRREKEEEMTAIRRETNDCAC